MGYLTEYSLLLNTTEKGVIEDVAKLLTTENSQLGFDIRFAFCHALNLNQRMDEVTYQWCFQPRAKVTWYDNDIEMKKLSTLFPAVHFTLKCHGEDGRRWQVHFINGKSQTCRGFINYEPFDPDKLT